MTGRLKIITLFLLLLALVYTGKVFASDVALIGSTGEATQEKLDALDETMMAALEEQGHTVYSPAGMKETMDKMAIESVESLQDAELIGSKVKVQFVVVAHITPLAGQDSIEIKAYYLPEGRVELLEEIAAEGETKMVVTGMLARLVTKGGLLGEKEPEVEKPPPGEEGEEGEEDIEKEIEDITKEGEEKEKEVDKEEDEKLVKDLQTWPEKKKRLLYGADFKISLELAGGPFVMLSKPVAGERIAGFASLSLGYVAVSVCGCDFGGEIRAFFGTIDAFSVTAFAGFNFRLSPKVPLYAGGRLSIGYLKNISGARSNRMILRGGANFNFVIRSRYMIMINPVGITLLAFDGDAVAFYDAGLGFGVRF